MKGTLKNVDGRAIILIENDGVSFTDAQDVMDFVMQLAFESGANLLAIDKDCLPEKFFILSSGVAGEILQKFVTYRFVTAIYGDYSGYTSKPLKDFIYESNQSSHIFFVENQDRAIEKFSKI